MLSAGGELEIPPVDGRCKVPESRDRAIAPAPRISGIATSATRRTIRANGPIIMVPAVVAPDYAFPLRNSPFLGLSERYKKALCSSTPFGTECRSFRGIVNDLPRPC